MLAATLAFAALVLFDVWGTAVFAVTVAYVLVPLHRRLTARGLSSWWASAVAAVAGTLAAAFPVVVALALAYLRRGRILSFVADLPDQVTIAVGGVSTVVNAQTIYDVGIS